MGADEASSDDDPKMLENTSDAIEAPAPPRRRVLRPAEEGGVPAFPAAEGLSTGIGLSAGAPIGSAGLGDGGGSSATIGATFAVTFVDDGVSELATVSVAAFFGVDEDVVVDTGVYATLVTLATEGMLTGAEGGAAAASVATDDFFRLVARTPLNALISSGVTGANNACRFCTATSM